MRILCAPDSFKESLTAAHAANAMARGALRAAPDASIDLCPIADGGEGTVEALVAAAGGTIETAAVRGPLPGMIVEAGWGRLSDGRTAVIELPAAAGLALLPRERRNPLHTTTFGVGQLCLAAIEDGRRDLIIGLGGSATCDGGCGLAQSLGVRFTLEDGRVFGAESGESMTGAHLELIRAIDLSAARAWRERGIQFIAAGDVTNPLYGQSGSAFVFAPQKGAGPAEVERLDRGLRRLASLLPHADAQGSGMGAAGGCSFGIIAMLAGSLRRGIELVLDAVDFDRRVRAADLVLTGEGRLDEQTLGGKAVSGVVAAAARCGVPVIAIVGDASPAARQWTQTGNPPALAAIYALADSGDPLADLMREAAERLASLAEVAVKQITR